LILGEFRSFSPFQDFVLFSPSPTNVNGHLLKDLRTESYIKGDFANLELNFEVHFQGLLRVLNVD
jgi:hypothetical protein